MADRVLFSVRIESMFCCVYYIRIRLDCAFFFHLLCRINIQDIFFLLFLLFYGVNVRPGRRTNSGALHPARLYSVLSMHNLPYRDRPCIFSAE